MRILFELGHPAHVYLFKDVIKALERKGHKTKIVVRERENMVTPLLKHFGFKYEELYPNAPKMVGKAITMLKNDSRLVKIVQKFKPDLMVGILSPYSAQASLVTKTKYVGFTDSEPTGIQLLLAVPFTNAIITPTLFGKEFSKEKHIRIPTYKEMAYLHTNRFKPDESVLADLSVKKGEKYVILRFGAFDASHDVGITGFSAKDKLKLLKEMKKYATVFISSELPLDKTLKMYELPTKPERMHDVLYYASLLVSDTQTMTTESACLGTPAIRSNKWVGPNDMTNFIELEKKYELIFNILEPEKAIKKAVELIKKDDLKKEWAKKREKLMKDKIDLSSFLVWFIEKYPESQEKMLENPKYYKKVK